MQELVVSLLILAAVIYSVWYFLRIGRNKGPTPRCPGCLGCSGQEPPENLPPVNSQRKTL